MFQIKICGITTPEDALLAAEAGADAIGLNFYDKSPRYVTPQRAMEIRQAILPFGPETHRPRIIGVHVNATCDEACEISLQAGVCEYQFHGDEPPVTIAALGRIAQLCRDSIPRLLSTAAVSSVFEDVRAQIEGESTIFGLPSRRLYPTLADQLRQSAKSGKLWFPMVIRAFRTTEPSLCFVSEYLQECKLAGALPTAILLDAHAPGSYGGTGQVVDWNMIREERDKLLGLPLILAGGLTPDNVAEAIATARPDAVDVASGVESSPGRKDPAKVRAFVAAAKEALARLRCTKE